MKILNPSQIYQTDKATIKDQKITSLDLMERAGLKCFNWIENHISIGQDSIFKVFCGVGNNGGDGLVIARHLLINGFKVQTYVVNFSDKRSADFIENLERLKNLDYWPIILNKTDGIPSLSKDDIIIDCIFGLGLKRNPIGFVKRIIQTINRANAFVLAIDFPSGLFAEHPVKDKEAVIKATHTLTFQVPKLAFLLPENKYYSASFEILDIGLSQDYIDSLSVKQQLTFNEDLIEFYKERQVFDHKGHFGHALIIGGSFGKMGAAVLALKGASKIGAGLLTGLVPNCGYQIIQSTVNEAMCLTSGENELESFDHNIKANAIGIGMGMGQSKTTQEALVNFLKKNEIQLVLDADAINCLAINPQALKYLKSNTIITPHPKELERLIGLWKNDYEKLDRVKKFSQKHQVIIVLKGAFTVVVQNENLYFNSTGNQALATGGSGDVLTGIITGLLAQNYTALQAARLGVYLHGLTADLAVRENETFETFIASDIISYLPKAFKTFLDPNVESE